MPRKIDYKKFSKEELIAEIIELKKRKKFGLVWDKERENEKVVDQCKKELPTLNELKSKSIQNNSKNPTHILIEGDNYHALSILNYTHKNKIDLIYIDPPYNTGAKDWTYNNNFVDLNDHWRHSKWVSLMSKRLHLAKNLLKEDGVLIITIDDNELFNLGVLCEEIFPSFRRYIITIEHNKRGRRGKNFAKTNEYAIFYVPAGKEIIQEQSLGFKIGGETRNLRRTGSGSKREERWKKFFPIWVNEKTLEIVSAGDSIPLGKNWKIERKNKLISVYPIDRQGIEKNWHYGLERTRDCISKNILTAKKTDYGIQVYYPLREKDSKKYKTVWTGPQFDASTYGTLLLEKILGQRSKFDFPKSLFAVLESIKTVVGSRKNAIILDFFAGSGTTAHAVMELNKNDGGTRQSISVTNNENNICKDVTYPRLRNIITGYEFSGNERNLIFNEELSISKLNKLEDVVDEFFKTKQKSKDNYDSLSATIQNNSLKLFGINKIEESKDGYKENLKYFKTAFVSAISTDRNKEKLNLKHLLGGVPIK